MRKPRTDSRLANLPEQQLHALSTWLRSGLHPIDCVKRLKAEFSVSSSSSAVYRFWQHYVEPELLRQRALAVETANKIRQALSSESGQLDSAVMAQIAQRAFEMSLNPKADAEQLFFLVKLILESKGQKLKADDLRLKREKFQFDAAKACLNHLPALRAIAADKGLSQDDKLKQVRLRLFGETPE